MSLSLRPMELPELVLAVNAWGTRPRLARGEHEAPLPSPRDVTPRRLLAGEAVERLVRLADAVYPVFTSGDDEERAALVTDLLERSGVRPVLLRDDEPYRGWMVHDPTARPLAAAAVALWLHLGDGGGAGDRLGTCADPACADAFVDASPGGHRRFCSTTCQNRARAAAFRRRHRRTDGPAGGP